MEPGFLAWDIYAVITLAFPEGDGDGLARGDSEGEGVWAWNLEASHATKVEGQ